MSLLEAIQPADLGLPDKFREYRAVQAEAIDFVLSSERSFIGCAAPTGTGKSLLAVTAAKVSGVRAAYLTATKGLQEQILADFEPAGMRDVRGQANYSCRVYTAKNNRNSTCEFGRQHLCSLRATVGCPYFAAVQNATNSQLISTNYAYWLHARSASPAALTPDSGTPIELLICDEAHSAFDQLAAFLAIQLIPDDFSEPAHFQSLTRESSGLMSEESGARWQQWARERNKAVTAELNYLKNLHGSVAAAREHDPRYQVLEELKRKLSVILTMDENWTWELCNSGSNSVAFDPIWPGRYSHLLWSAVPRVLLLSATLRPYTLALLGLKRADYDFREFENGWPKNLAPVYYLPTAKLNFKSTDEDYQRVASRIDQIIESRLDRKGIIHTVSYARMRKLLAHSKYARYMLFNERARDVTETAMRFRNSAPPAVLVSPSFSTGFDFAYSACEYQIVPKVPFSYAESRVMQERSKDRAYRIYTALLELQQMIGRGRRAPDDRCETFILDENLPMVLAQGKPYILRDFRVHKIQEVPKPAKKLLQTVLRKSPSSVTVSSSASVLGLEPSTVA